jgi:hypothetical protein
MRVFKDADVDVSLHWEHGGRQLGPGDIEAARRWLLSVEQKPGKGVGDGCRGRNLMSPGRLPVY